MKSHESQIRALEKDVETLNSRLQNQFKIIERLDLLTIGMQRQITILQRTVSIEGKL